MESERGRERGRGYGGGKKKAMKWLPNLSKGRHLKIHPKNPHRVMICTPYMMHKKPIL